MNKRNSAMLSLASKQRSNNCSKTFAKVVEKLCKAHKKENNYVKIRNNITIAIQLLANGFNHTDVLPLTPNQRKELEEYRNEFINLIKEEK